MLTRIRGSLNSFVVLVLMGLLIAVFALWGIGDIFRNPGVQSVATVDGEDIPVTDFASRMQRVVADQQKANPEFDLALAIRLGYDQVILSQMVREKIIELEARHLGLTASNKQVSTLIAQEAGFQLAGQFDVTRYQQFLLSSKLSEEKLFDNIRMDKARADLSLGLVNGIIAPSLMIDPQVRFLTEKRTGTVVTLPVSTYAVTETPDDATLQSFFEEHADRYRTPEYRSFNYVTITVEDISRSISVSDEQLVTEYEARKDLYTTEELRRVNQVILQNAEDAAKFRARVTAGESFAVVANDMGGFSEDDINLGDLSETDVESQYGADIAQAIFTLSAATVTDAVQTPFGWAVYQVTNIQPGLERPLAEVREELRALVTQDQALSRVYETSQQLEDAFATGANLAEAAQSLGLTFHSIGPVSRTGVASDGKNAATQALVREMLESVYQLDIGNVLESLPLGDTGYFVPEITSIDPERAMTLDEARDQLVSEWRRIETDRRAREAADVIAKEATTASALGLIAKQHGLDVVENISFTRLQMQQAGARGAAAAQILFNVEKGQTDVSQSAGGSNYVIAHLSTIEDGKVDRDSLEYNALSQQITQLLQNDIQGQYLDDLQKKYDVRINDRTLQTYRNQITGSAPTF